MAGSIRQRSKGSWTLTFDGPPKPNGDRRQITKTVRGTKREAQKVLTEEMNNVNKGTFDTLSRASVSTYLDQWLELYAKQQLASTSYDRYADVVNRVLKPSFGGSPLTTLRPVDIQAEWVRLVKLGLSAKTVLLYHRILHRACAVAVQWELLLRNPCDGVEAPRPKRPERSVLNEGEMSDLISLTKDSHYHIVIVLAITTGMRVGEICGLRWSDIDLDGCSLKVNHTLALSGGKLFIKEPKTPRSKRIISLPGPAIEALRAQRSKQDGLKTLLGSAYRAEDFVFCRDNGSIQRPCNVSTGIRKLLAQCKVDSTIHGLRHTHASLLMREGVHPKVVSERMGHSNIGITLDTYSHVLPSQQEDAARRVDIALGWAGPPAL